jgi:short-subunit dehydrogenase
VSRQRLPRPVHYLGMNKNESTAPLTNGLGNPLAAAAAPSIAREIHEGRPPLAVITGASTGIGYELARECAKAGYDMVIAADEAEIHEVAKALRGFCGMDVQAVHCDLATPEGIEMLLARVGDRPVDALLANAGRALGHAFFDQQLEEALRVIRTNVEGTVRLVHHLGRPMRARGKGRILITSSIAAFAPAPFMALYNASKAFLHSFSFALRGELKDSGVTVTCLLPGVTDTDIFRRSHTEDTKLATEPRMDPAEVARQGFEAMLAGKDEVITGWNNKLTVAQELVAPAGMTADATAKRTAPGSAHGR